jgi:putative glycosyltransferase protein
MERLGEKKPVIQFVGRYGPEKGLNRILESFAACAADFPEWVLRINGNGLEEEILAVEKYLAQLDPETVSVLNWGGGSMQRK